IEILQGCNKDEFDFFVSGFGVEGFKEWAADRKERGLSNLTNKEKALNPTPITSRQNLLYL
ncbi:MAG: hypothetical protein II687_00150, partial [Selenomonadaceae bacterium]|nr:hypothetical protein [Selenomonadaceae bacterium]